MESTKKIKVKKEEGKGDNNAMSEDEMIIPPNSVQKFSSESHPETTELNDLSPLTTLPTDISHADESQGECEDETQEYCWPNVDYYVSNSGDIINKGTLSDPESSIASATTDIDDLELPDDDNFREWCELDPSDEEEEENLSEKYFDLFKVIDKEQILLPEDLEEHPGDLNDAVLDSSHMGLILPLNFFKLDLSGHRLPDVSVVEHFSSLRFLNVSKNFIRNVKCLGKLRHLVQLDVSDNEISRFLDIFSQMPHPLREVNFSKNQITEIVPFNRFLSLTNINLAYNRLQVIQNFQHCYFLRFLNLSHNRISEIYNLDCPNLLVLLLQDNELENLSSLKKCNELRYLNISRNKISDLSPLRLMPRMVEFRCTNNKIDLLQMDVLKSLIYMSHLRITPNPCTDVGLPRQMLIFTLPQIRYLDKTIVTPEEIVEANNIFKPPFEKIAFEDHLNNMLERAKQSAHMLFGEFCEMNPLPPILFFVGSPKSRSIELAIHLKEKFHNRILLGGVHSTATTIETGIQNVDIPISLERFIEMKRSGQLLSSSTILGRLCGFSATQFIRAVEHGALLVGINIPLETAICLRKWGFKATSILIMPSDPPHFNVDSFLEKENRRRSLPITDEDKSSIGQIHKGRRISFREVQSDFEGPKNLNQHSILKINPQGVYAEELGEIYSLPTENLELSALEIINPEPMNTIDNSKSLEFADDPHVDVDVDELNGEDGNYEHSLKSDTEGTLTYSGVKIINPVTINGIDWKRTILWSDFYEAILSMDQEYHFLLTQNSIEPLVPLSREILEETISNLGYDLVHGPTKIYMTMDVINPDTSTPSTFPESEIKYQLIVVKRKRSSTSLQFPSCSKDYHKKRIQSVESLQFLVCEDEGEDGLPPLPNLRPKSPWYERYAVGEDVTTEIEGEEANVPLLLQNDQTNDNDEEDSDTAEHHNKFKHRDAMATSILKIRDEYLKYHLENPGFFSKVLDTWDLDKSKALVEVIVGKMLDEFERDHTNSKNYSLVESYAQISGAEHLAAKFLNDRLERMQKLDNDAVRGYDHSCQHRNIESTSVQDTIFKRSRCPKNLLSPTLPKGHAAGQIYQLQRAEFLRKERMEQKLCEFQPVFDIVKNDAKKKNTTKLCQELGLENCKQLETEVCPEDFELNAEIWRNNENSGEDYDQYDAGHVAEDEEV